MEFNFWKHNLLTQHYKLTADELKQKFVAWLPTQDTNWLEYYGTYQCYICFVASELQSVEEPKESEQVKTLLKDVFWNHIESTKQSK
jgi:hypothetical protein